MTKHTQFKAPWEYTVQTDDSKPSVKPTLVSIKRDASHFDGPVTLETQNPTRKAVVKILFRLKAGMLHSRSYISQ